MAKNRSQKKRQQQQQQQQQGGEGAAEHALKVFGNMNEQRAVSQSNNTIAMKQTGGKQRGQDDEPVENNLNDGQPDNVVELNNGVDKDNKINSSQSLENGDSNGQQEKPTSQGEIEAYKLNQNKEPRKISPHDSITGGKQSKQQLQKSILKQLKQLKQQGGSSLSFSEFSASAAPQQQQQSGPNAVAKIAVNDAPAQSAMGPTKGGNGQQLDLRKGLQNAGPRLSKQQLQSLNQQLDKLQQQQQQQGGVGLNEIVVPLILLYASQRYSKGKSTRKNVKFSKKSRRLTK